MSLDHPPPLPASSAAATAASHRSWILWTCLLPFVTGILLGAVILPLWYRSPFAPAREKLRSLGIDYTPDGLVFAVYGHNAEAVRLFHAAGFPLNAWDTRNEFALGAAAASHDAALVKLLLELGCRVEQPSGWGNTALAIAARGGRPEIVRLLLDSGAQVNATDDLGYTALDHATHQPEGGGWTPVRGVTPASAEERRDTISLLRDRGAKTGAEIRLDRGQPSPSFPTVIP
jgi:Ankyrin repeats (3 copies)